MCYSGIMAGAPCPVEVMKKVIQLMHMTKVTVSIQSINSFFLNFILIYVVV